MIRVMIVEDEYLIRELIKKTIDWQQHGFEIVSEAEDGEQALERIEVDHPQLILIDINMPFIDGLQLAEMIAGKYKQIKMIIITGHSKFEYAKRAMKSGVMRYVLKPINEHELIEALEEARKTIIEQEDDSEYMDLLEEQTQKNVQNSRDKFMHTLIHKSSHDEQVLVEKAKYYHLVLENKSLMAIVIEIDHFRDSIKQADETKIWLFAVNNMANEIFRARHVCEMFIDNDKQIVILLNGQSDLHQNQSSDFCMAACQQLKQVVADYLGFSLSFGISGVHNGFSDLHLAYQEAITALDNKYSDGESRILQYEDQRKTDSQFDFLVFNKKEALLYHLRKKEEKAYLNIIHDIYQQLRLNKVEKEYVQVFTIEMIAIAIAFVAESRLSIDQLFISRQSCIDEIQKKETIFEVRDWVIDVYKQAQALVADSVDKKSSKIINEIKAYIDEHYMMSSMSLDDLAHKVHMNPSYLSNLFKREAGCTITEYARNIRMAKAKELIDSKSVEQITQVAEAVGYADPYYFSKCFKKHFGTNFSDYVDRK